MRFQGDLHARNEVILGLFYEETGFVLDQLRASRAGQGAGESEIDLGDFITGIISNEHIRIIPSGIESKSYEIRIADLIDLLEQWLEFRSMNRDGVVRTVTIEAEVV